MNDPSSSSDVVVIGGGVIGLSIAWELAQRGQSVRLLEQGLVGQEASWAGAGILPPGNVAQARTTEARLRAESHQLWTDWSERLQSQTGIDNGYLRCGGVEITAPAETDSRDAKMQSWRSEGVVAEPLDAADLRHRLPMLNPAIQSGYFLPELGQVRNPRHLKALVRACRAAGVQIHPGSPVIGFQRTGDRIESVTTGAGNFAAAEFVVATGAWSRLLLQHVGHQLPLEPVRGQMVLLETQADIRHVIEVGLRYLVPRRDGRILIGSTEERVGFEKRTTAGGVEGLIQFGRELVPALAEATLERCWAGLRPHLPGGLPRIGRVPGLKNLTVAAGHFRAGLQLSPITAILVRQLVNNEVIVEWAQALASAPDGF